MTVDRRALSWLSRAVPGGMPAGVACAQALLAAGLVVYAAHSLTGAGSDHPLLEDWLYNGLLVGAAVMCMLRAALVAQERMAWLMLGAGLASWSTGVVLVTVQPPGDAAGFPSLPDVLWLGFYPAAYAGLVLLVRARVQQFYASLWLDGAVGALALAAVVAALVFPGLLTGVGGDPTDVLANLSYPVADMLLAGFVVWVCALTEWRPGRVLGVVATALMLGAVADGFSLWWVTTGHATEMTALDWLWPASAVLLGFAAWQPARAHTPVQLSGLRPLALPVVFAASSLCLLLYSRAQPIDTAGFVLAAATLAAVIARMGVTFVENARMGAQAEHDAVTDALTGLGNRRCLIAELREALTAARQARPYALLLFDLDGFKAYNDTFGHPAGDALLARLGSRLREAVGDDGVACRLGGDEFCALVRPQRRSLEAIVAATTRALSEHGPDYTIGTSHGVVMLPEEAAETSAALQIADERLYANKGERRRAREGQQILDVLTQVMYDREPGRRPHLERVAALARLLGQRLDLAESQLDDLAQTATLHELGRAVAPHTPMPATERILGAAPALRSIAQAIRATEERFDGSGPDGLAGEAIPLPARIIAACDAYDDASANGAPSRANVRAGIDELRAGAGSRFDPAVVEALCAQLPTVSLAPVSVTTDETPDLEVA